MTDQHPPIEAEVVPSDDPKQSQALVVRAGDLKLAPSGLFGTQEPVAIIEKATTVATALKAVITRQGLVSKISGKEYPKCEAWTLLGTMLGVFPVLCWSKPVQGGWEARVEARTRDGAIVGAAEAQCLRSERNWKDRDDFALRSMAQTRATAKCLRMPLGFVMTLAGYEATPAEEMVSDHPHAPAKPPGRAEPKIPPSTPTLAVKTPPAATSERAIALKPPTEATRKWMLDELHAAGLFDLAQEYFTKLNNPMPLMPDEPLTNLRLIFVPNSRDELKMLITRLKAFGNGDRAEIPYAWHWEAEGKQAIPAKAALPTEPPKDPLWWRDIIIPIPRRGMKKNEYNKDPDTIGRLFDARHKEDEESNYMRQRLWGILEGARETNWIPQPRKVGDQTYNPTDADRKCYEALRAFDEWFKDNHRGEKI